MQSSGGGSSRSGLSRYRSAPATWLEALLEDEEEDPLKQNHCLTQLLSDNPPPPLSRASVGLSSSSAAASPSDSSFFESGTGFLRQNSSPADFLGSSAVDSDGYFSNYRNLDFTSPNIDGSSTGKRQREQISPNYPSYQLKMEQGIGQDLEMENFLEGDDSVSFRVRAKRGCATHPRSIAERVRRTKISDRIRKLQELVPNMDKQTNTADMLDEAVEYVKLLQKQIQELSEQQKSCKCGSAVDCKE